MSAEDGPFGPGLRGRPEEEKSRRYLRSTKALWHLNKVADLTIADNFGIRRGGTKTVISQSEYKAIERAEIRSPLSRAIADKQLLLEQQ